MGVIRSIDDAVDDESVNVKLFFNEGNFFWGKIEERAIHAFGEIENEELFKKYNPKLRKVIARLDKVEEDMGVVALSRYFGVKVSSLCEYFRIHPDLKDPRDPIKKPLAYKLAAEFMPMIEGWPSAARVARSLDISSGTVHRNCSAENMESYYFFGRWRIPPTGVIDLKYLIRNMKSYIIRDGERYTPLTVIARKAAKARRIDEKVYCAKLFHIVSRYPDSFTGIEDMNRKYFDTKSAHNLANLMTLKELSDYLGVSQPRARRLCNIGKIDTAHLGTLDRPLYASAKSLKRTEYFRQFKVDIIEYDKKIKRCAKANKEKAEHLRSIAEPQMAMILKCRDFSLDYILQKIHEHAVEGYDYAPNFEDVWLYVRGALDEFLNGNHTERKIMLRLRGLNDSERTALSGINNKLKEVYPYEREFKSVMRELYGVLSN